MGRTAVAALITALSFSLQAQAPRDVDDILAQVRTKLRSMTSRLPRYTCVQTVERHYYRHAEQKNPPSCDQMAADRKMGRFKQQLYATDRLRLDVAVSGGREIVAWAGASKFDSRTPDEVIGEGPTGTGAFGLYLVDIFNNSGTHFQYLGEKASGDRRVLEYRFTNPLKASNYRIRGNGEWHFTAYDGTFQVDAQSLELQKLDLRTDELPEDTGMCESSTSLEYQRLKVGESEFLLPLQGDLRILQRDGKETSNVTTFSSCHEYHTDSTIRFEEAPEAETARGESAAAERHGLPVGLSLALALTAKIDTNTAAAGDLVTAKVARAVREPKSKTVLIPAGAIARGRITRMRHRIGGPDDFVILISFDSVEINGVASPLFIRLDSAAQLERARITNLSASRRSRMMDHQGPETWGALLFPAAKSYVVPAGYESEWLTIEPPAPKTEAK
jgi:hypothetical protein